MLGVFIDANLELRIAEFLRKEGYPAEYSDKVLDEDATRIPRFPGSRPPVRP
jgi:hypothetical protein